MSRVARSPRGPTGAGKRGHQPGHRCPGGRCGPGSGLDHRRAHRAAEADPRRALRSAEDDRDGSPAATATGQRGQRGSGDEASTSELAGVPICPIPPSIPPFKARWVPRDRGGSFDPAIVQRWQRRSGDVGTIVLSLYAKGLTTGEVSAHFAEIYGASVSKDPSAGSPTGWSPRWPSGPRGRWRRSMPRSGSTWPGTRTSLGCEPATVAERPRSSG